MTTRAQYRSAVQTFYEDANFESVSPMSPLFWEDDFVGAGHSAIPAFGAPVAGYAWVKRIVGVGPPTVAPIANAPGGQFQLALAATSEAEDADLYFNDSLCVNAASKGAVFETRSALTVPPSAAGVQAVWGLFSAWISGPANFTSYIAFGCTANNGLLITSKDGIAAPFSFAAAQIAGAAVLLDTNFHTFRIETASPADIAFYMDGNRVNAVGSVTYSATGATAVLQPYFSVYKPSGTGLATLVADKASFWSNR